MKKSPLIIISIIISILLITKFYFLSPGYHFPFIITPMRLIDDSYRLTAVILGFISLGVVLYLYFLARRIDKINIYNKLGIVSLLISILLYYSFYLIQMKYTYEEHPKIFGYFSSDLKYIEDKEKYFSLVKKYGFTQNGYKSFNTLEDNIEALDFANKNNLKGLYRSVFYDLEKFGYDKVFEKYQDKTFQVYFISNLLDDNFAGDNILYKNNIEKIGNYKININNEILIFIINNLIKYNKLNKNNFDINHFSDFYDLQVIEIGKIEGINWDLF